MAALEAAKAALLGAVLNRVDFEHNAYYDQHYHYRREYGPYYARSPKASGRHPSSVKPCRSSLVRPRSCPVTVSGRRSPYSSFV